MKAELDILGGGEGHGQEAGDFQHFCCFNKQLSDGSIFH